MAFMLLTRWDTSVSVQFITARYCCGSPCVIRRHSPPTSFLRRLQRHLYGYDENFGYFLMSMCGVPGVMSGSIPWDLIMGGVGSDSQAHAIVSGLGGLSDMDLKVVTSWPL